MTEELSTSLEQCLLDERAAHSALALVDIQSNALVERFHRDWLALDARRRQLVDELERHNRAIRVHRQRIELTRFPAELREWARCAISTSAPSAVSAVSAAALSAGSAAAVSAGSAGALSAGSAGALSAGSAGALSAGSAAAVSAGSAGALSAGSAGAAAALLLSRGRDRAVSAVRSASPDIGRVLIATRAVSAGDSLLSEAPLLRVADDSGDGDPALPPSVRAAMDSALRARDDVFAAQRWDRSAARLFFYWFAALRFAGDGDFAQRWDALCCPADAVEPRALSRLADMARFLLAALPRALADFLSGGEEQVLRVLLTLRANAVRYGGGREGGDEDAVHAELRGGVAVLSGISLAEHNCDPNAIVVFRHDGGGGDGAVFAELRATRDVPCGDRVSIAYVPAFLPRDERQRRLRDGFFFQCACARCTSDPDTARLLCVSRDEDLFVAPIGSGGRWQLMHGAALSPAEQCGAADARVLNALRDEAALLTPAQPPNSECVDSEWLTEELRAIGVAMDSSAAAPLHFAFLLRAVRAAGLAVAQKGRAAALAREVTARLLRDTTPRVFALPPELRSAFLSGERLTGDARGLAARRATAPHATLVAALWEAHAALCEASGDARAAANAWAAAVLIVRYGLCQDASDRCLRAQLRALHCQALVDSDTCDGDGTTGSDGGVSCPK